MNLKKRLIPALLASTFVSTAYSITAVANDSAELEELRALVQQLEQKVKVIDRKSELAEEAAAAKKKETPVLKASADGFSFASADGKNEIKFRGLIQADHRHYSEGDNDVRGRSNNRAGTLDADGFHDAENSSLLRRVRPTIEGKVNGKYGFRFTPDFGGGSATVVDAYVEANLDPAFNIRAGKFKSFVGLERLQGGGDIKFIERSYVTNAILPNRDLGVAVYGDVLDKKVNYAFGIVNGVADGGNIATGTEYNGEREYTARLFTTPFSDSTSALSGLGFGIAGTYTNYSGDRNLDYAGGTDVLSGGSVDATRNGLPSYVTEGQQTFYRYSSAAVADGKRLRWTPQAYYYNGPFGLITEYARVSQDTSLLTTTSGNTGAAFQPGSNKTLNHDAWNIGISYLITGEDASFKGVKPKSDFDIDKGGWGAWELVARYSEINLDKDTFKNRSGTYGQEKAGTDALAAYSDLTKSPEAAKTWTAGINWYLNKNTKFAVNYAQTKFEGGASTNGSAAVANGSNIKDRDDEKAILARFQVAF